MCNKVTTRIIHQPSITAAHSQSISVQCSPERPAITRSVRRGHCGRFPPLRTRFSCGERAVFVPAASEERHTPDWEKTLPPPGPLSHSPNPHPRGRSRQRLSEGPGRPQFLRRSVPAGRRRRDPRPAREVRNPRGWAPGWRPTGCKTYLPRRAEREVSCYPTSTSASGFRHEVSVRGGGSGASRSGCGWPPLFPDLRGGGSTCIRSRLSSPTGPESLAERRGPSWKRDRRGERGLPPGSGPRKLSKCFSTGLSPCWFRCTYTMHIYKDNPASP